MSDTRNKFNEAIFFFERMKEYLKNKDKSSEFDYFLNAFVGSARSVLWIMKAEFSRNNEWNEWYNSIEIDAQIKHVFDITNQLRILSVKYSPIKSEEQWTFIPDEKSKEVFYDIWERANKGLIGIYLKDDNGNLHKLIDKRKSEETVEGDSKYDSAEDLEDKCKIMATMQLHKFRGIDAQNGYSLDVMAICEDYISILGNIVSDCEKHFAD